MKTSKSAGFILVTVMIFLMMLSLIAWRVFNHDLLQLKIVQAWQIHRQLFFTAENLLANGEKTLESRLPSLQVKPVTAKACPNAYQVTAKTCQGFDCVILQSVYCSGLGRLSWRELENEEGGG